jgi:hypothetical protein
VNTNDWALLASEKLSTKGRCGAKARVYEGADTIDTTALTAKQGYRALWAEGWNHDAFVRVPLLFGEITRLLLAGTRPPDKRTPDLLLAKNDEGKTYWRFDDSRIAAPATADDRTLKTGANPTTKWRLARFRGDDDAPC